MSKDDIYSLYSNDSYRLMWNRVGEPRIDEPDVRFSAIEGIKGQAHLLRAAGGFTQQQRMIKDKRKSLDKALLYSYQAGFVKKYIPNDVQVMDGEEARPVRALINPNKLKQDYDDKIISIGFENNFQCGDIFEWCNTNSHWIIYLQDIDELAYFRGDIRRCNNIITWKDDDGELHSTYVAIRGPVETKINSIQKGGISVDTPNYTLSILMPNNEYTMKKFQRYAKFYIQNQINQNNIQDKICWRVNTADSISTPGILEIIAEEYYSNKFEDDIENGVAEGLIVEKADPNPSTADKFVFIDGPSFIKPKITNKYILNAPIAGEWEIVVKAKKDMIKYKTYTDDKGNPTIELKWDSSYSGQFELKYNKYSKTVVVESLY